ncbi:retinol dehydrogenase 13-like [Leptidea sinapis]|uniref:retinol dehydrogenase 13-like n=1 Tax=Leptidea sinapis TaxID=189913 RepID=UPI0021C41D5D|nr:retinol dehydrogenase 13-like [Leptidea sinapis]
MNVHTYITGGNSGIGFETAKYLAKRGARVIIADINNAKTTVANIIHIRLFADKFNKSVDQLDILVNNAGCYTFKKFATEDGLDLIMQVNNLGPFLMTKLFMEKLLRHV